jgi:Leucine-rich repeat (LRR) protein
VEIRINGNELSAIPEEIGYLSNLEIIDMSTNLISAIPNSLGSLKKIKKLNLKENKIAKVNKSISNLTMLADVDISSNVIESIEKGAFSAMCSLVILNLCQNKLVEFSEIPTSQKLDSLLLVYYV